MFQSIERRPPDPILGLSATFKKDTNPNKIDLGVGVYKDESGNTPVVSAIKKAEQKLWQTEDSKSYIAQAGPEGFTRQMAAMILGEDSAVLNDKRACSILAPGGSGALRLAAEFVSANFPNTRTWISAPTWANHVPLLSSAGLDLVEYPYYNYDKHEIDIDQMMDTLKQATVGDLVLIHGCCHNPCGGDLSKEQWQAFAEAAEKQGFTPFVDLAYQGLGDGLEEDVYGVRLLTEKLPEVIIASSCSKNFGLYRERTGTVTLVGESADQVSASASQIVSTARQIYSMPPSHGAAMVEIVLSDPALKAEWITELTGMRERINGLRSQLAAKLKAVGVEQDFSFIEREKGMFSFLGLSPEQVQTLIDDYSIYMVKSSRINVAGISSSNIDYLTQSLAKVL
ncbi:MAG: aromatic amino acid aminotransferase [SAR86 cluster bacterium]|uniref:Aromatic amino acid aminotransferase n=1 Tax=SAR86 cluster bacterium TaxID=2030880 RepID=A0A2A5CDB2_9GAMM|nr:aspartate/tyrosine/aromatic aminotransferase [Gammaproteobacteria bacterium AH-315-E17]PCJ41501.1 MAG: aromatic amino acid aminotransferase [SAR86 cluster bacterium]